MGETIDQAEAAKFAALSLTWHDPNGPLRTLHHLAPARMTYIVNTMEAHFKKPLAGLSVLDIGCGGGLVAEPLARLHMQVTGIDAADKNIAAARHHAEQVGLAINYQAAALEDINETFDVVLALEVLEHVASPQLFIKLAAERLRPGGLIIFSTINRTARAYLGAIIGAEYVLRLLPRGTHEWRKFMTPAELSAGLYDAGCKPHAPVGMRYNPFTHKASLTTGTAINYFLSAGRG